MPSARQVSQWRTFLLAESGLLALLAGLAISGHWPAAAVQFPAFAGAVTGIVFAVSAKSGYEHGKNADAAATAKEPAASVLAQGATG